MGRPGGRGVADGAAFPSRAVTGAGSGGGAGWGIGLEGARGARPGRRHRRRHVLRQLQQLEPGAAHLRIPAHQLVSTGLRPRGGAGPKPRAGKWGCGPAPRHGPPSAPARSGAAVRCGAVRCGEGRRAGLRRLGAPGAARSRGAALRVQPSGTAPRLTRLSSLPGASFRPCPDALCDVC